MNVTKGLRADKDLTEICRIWNESFPGAQISVESFARQFSADFPFLLNDIVIAGEGGEIAGFSAATSEQIPYAKLPGQKDGFIPFIAVRKNRRGNGVGTRLLSACEAILAERAETAHIGYPAYLRGTVLSLMGVEASWTHAAGFLKSRGYASGGEIDTMVLELPEWNPPDGYAEGLDEAGKAGFAFAPLSRVRIPEFFAFLRENFPGWGEQIELLERMNLLPAENTLVATENTRICGFAGPWFISDSGEAAGVGLGMRKDLRGKGLGLLLLCSFCGLIKRRGGSRVVLFGAVDKTRYYGKAGFIPGPVWTRFRKTL